MGMLFSLIGFVIAMDEFIYAIIKENNEIKEISLKYMIFFIIMILINFILYKS